MLSMSQLHQGREKALRNYIQFQNIKVEESTKLIKQQRDDFTETRRHQDIRTQDWQRVKAKV